MDNLYRIGYCLSASGTLLTEDLNYLIYANGGTLTEETWDPETGEVTKTEDVGYGVKENAPVAYVWFSNDAKNTEGAVDEGIGAEERIIFSVTPDNKIIAFKYDSGDEEVWNEAIIGNTNNVEVHPETGLAVALNADGIYLFFINPDGKLQATVGRGGDNWILTEAFDVKPRTGTPLTTSVTEESSSLFYFGIDNTLHYLHRSNDSQSWVDHTVDNFVVTTPVTRFRASSENGQIESYVLTEGKLFRFSQSGEPVEIGIMQERDLKKHNNAQNVRWVHRGCRPSYYRVKYIVVYYYFIPRVRGWCW